MVITSFSNEKGELIIYGGEFEERCYANVGQKLLDVMLHNATKVAQIDAATDTKYTFHHLRQFSIQCALEMRRRGILAGDVIGLIGKSGNMNLPIPFLSSLYLGCTLCPMYPDYSYNEIHRIYGLARPKMIFCDSDCLDLLTRLIKDLDLNASIITFENDFQTFITQKDPVMEWRFEAQQVDPDKSIALIICTSGTTGLVKGVTVTHSSFFEATAKCSDFVQPTDCMLWYSPISWLSYPYFYYMMVLKGATKIICEYDPTENLKIATKYKVDWMFLTPAKMQEMVNHPKFKNYPEIRENLKFVLLGGSYTSPESMSNYQKLFKNALVYNGYGSTECFGFHAYFSRVKDSDQIREKFSSHGKVPIGVHWKLIDPETKKSVGRNTPGELCVKTNVCKGYYKEPEQTKLAVDEDGFFHTGDKAIVDDDNCLYIVGRYKELLKYKGWQVSPAELVEVIKKHDAVHEVFVTGKPHSTDGELPIAFVSKKTGFEKVTEQEIVEFVDKMVPDIQRLRGGVVFLDKLPQTPSGKYNQKKLKSLIPN